MTYGELLVRLIKADTRQLDQDVTVYDLRNDEFYKMEGVIQTLETDVLDKDHLALCFNPILKV